MQTPDTVITKIQENPDQPLTASESEHGRQATERGVATKFAWRLWERMTEIYGHRWTSSYGEEPNGAWCGVLASLTGDQVKHGLNALLNSTDPWPPTAIQFRQLCTGDDGLSWERQSHRIYEPDRRLEDLSAKERARVAADNALSDMRAMLGI